MNKREHFCPAKELCVNVKWVSCSVEHREQWHIPHSVVIKQQCFFFIFLPKFSIIQCFISGGLRFSFTPCCSHLSNRALCLCSKVASAGEGSKKAAAINIDADTVKEILGIYLFLCLLKYHVASSPVITMLEFCKHNLLWPLLQTVTWKNSSFKDDDVVWPQYMCCKSACGSHM